MEIQCNVNIQPADRRVFTGQRAWSLHWRSHREQCRRCQACPWLGICRLSLLCVSTSSLSKARLSASKNITGQLLLFFWIGDNCSKLFSKIRLKWTICYWKCMTIRSGGQIKTRKNPYNNYYLGWKWIFPVYCMHLPFPELWSTENQEKKMCIIKLW